MPRLPRPPGLPRRIPKQWWTWLKLPGVHHIHKPATFWVWRSWRLGHKPSGREIAVKWALSSLHYSGRMRYTETSARSQLFDREPGDFMGSSADCSQFSAAILNWSGVKGLTNTDYTGTLLQKGKAVKDLQAGDGVFFGPGTAVHMGIASRKIDDVWQIVEFGEQSAPDETPLPILIAYFKKQGHPGVRYRDFFAGHGTRSRHAPS